MRTYVIARKTHKWLGLFIGLQVVVWSLSGLYMTVVHIDTIHGDHLVREASSPGIEAGGLQDPLALAAREKATGIRLAWVDERPIYVTEGPSRERAFAATSAAPLKAPNEQAIRALASSYYTGSEPIASADLITDVPGEIRGRGPPLWRVEFAHWNRPTFYLSPVTGELLSRRHDLWRVFDFVWMLHIMDYDERENVNNPLLRAFTWGAVLMALSGIWLLFYAFPRREEGAQHSMTIKSIWLRRIHKWVGLAIGLQFVLWAISGAAMALLDMETVAGGPRPQAIQSALAGEATGWPAIVRQLDGGSIEGLRLKTLLDRPVVEVRTARSTQMFDARTGVRVKIDAAAARAIVQSNHPNGASPGAAKLLTERSLPVRDHEPPIWQVDFADDDASTYYVSATTGAVLERRNDTWRWWDFFWMLHNMDYSDRTSFNHPLIITAGIAMAWLAVTGFWLLFRTMWRHDFAWLRIRRTRQG